MLADQLLPKRTPSVKQVMLTVFFDINGPIVQVSVPRGRTETGKFYYGRILGKLNI